MQVTYYKDGDSWLAATDEYPKGFKGVVFVGKGPSVPGDIASIREQAFSVEQLKRMTRAGISDVPPDWLLALGYHMPAPPKPPQDEIVEEEFPILDESGENLEALVTLPVRRRVLRPAPAARPSTPEELRHELVVGYVAIAVIIVVVILIAMFK